MGRIYTSIDELIGHTPLLELTHLERRYELKARLLAKLEYCNPAGSVKDRAAREMLDCAERDGSLKPGAVIIEPTSGNTGIGLAAVGTARGYRTVIVMPDTMSVERRQILKAYGAELVLVSGGMPACIEKAKELQKEYPRSWIAGQFDNPANAEAHRKTTAPEIFEDTDGNVDIFVAGIGTGGTVTGTGEYLKSRKPEIRVIGVEPANSPVLSGGAAGAHGLMGIGAGFVPEVLHPEVLDEIMTVTEEDAYRAGRELASKEGILVGISSGAALWAAIEAAKRSKNAGKTIVVLLPDGGDRYLSTPMFTE